jgi:hypothetical protein
MRDCLPRTATTRLEELMLGLDRVGLRAVRPTPGRPDAREGQQRPALVAGEKAGPAQWSFNLRTLAEAPELALLDDLVGSGEERGRNTETERLCGFQIDDELGPSWVGGPATRQAFRPSGSPRVEAGQTITVAEAAS